MATKNLKRTERERQFALYYAVREQQLEASGEQRMFDWPLKKKYTAVAKAKSVKSKRSGNSGGKASKHRWGPYRNPPSPWDRK